MISCIILTKNNQNSVQKTLKSISFCNEIIVIDDNSIDKTIEIVKRFGAKVFRRPLNSNFSAQRNFGLSKASHKWVLFVDSDEIVSKDLAKEIVLIVKKNSYDGLYIKRTDFWLGKKIGFGDTKNKLLIRLGKKSGGLWKRNVHEVWHIKGKIGILKSKLLHFPHPSIKEFLDEIVFYSELHAYSNVREKKTSSIFKILVFPTAKFLYNLFINIGIIDGTHGFIIATLMSFHSFLSWSNQWLKSKNQTN